MILMTDFKQKQPSNRLEVTRSEQTKEKISRTMKEVYKRQGFSEERKRKIGEKMRENWRRRKEEYLNNEEKNRDNYD